MKRTETILIFFMIWLKSTTANTTCPITECTCDKSSTNKAGGRIIDCRDKNLDKIPNISLSDEIFQEITFSNVDTACKDTITCKNRIWHIADNAFAGLKVKKIDFSTNILVSIMNGAFSGLESYLTELSLEGDDKPIQLDFLANLTNLKVLKLEHFKLNTISSLPQEFVNLEKLVLHTIQLTYLSADAVSGMRNLKKLEILDNSNYTSFPTSAIIKLTNIQHVSFVQNGLTQLQSLGNAFSLNTKFTELDLSHNNIHILQNNCFDSLEDKLEYLGLHNNNLKGDQLGPLANANWTKLEQLILDGNPLGQNGIPSNLFKNMPNLANLNLQKVQLTHIKQNDFEGLTNLHSLHLTHNHITQIKAGAFQNTPNLKLLYLDLVGQASHLNFSSQTAKGLEKLEQLDLTETKIESDHFWSSISVMVGLKWLTLNKNQLSNIPDLTFKNNKKLEILEIENNGLTEVTQAQIHGLGGSLKTLNIKGNSIKLIDKCVIKELTDLTMIYLANNSMHCDCTLLDLYDWAKQRRNNDFIFSFNFQAKCESPPSLQDRYIIGSNDTSDIPRDQLICNSSVQPIQCQTFTTTATTPAPTSPVVPTVPLPIIIFTITGRVESEVLTSWTTQNTDQLKGFIITSELSSSSNIESSQKVDASLRQYKILLFHVDQDYTLCIKATTTDGRTTTPECQNYIASLVSTSMFPPVNPPGGLTDGEKAAIGTGSAILIILIVLIIVFLLRYQNKPKYKDTPPVHFTAVARPAVGYDSKRFSKPKKGAKVNGDIIISAISSGKTVEPSSPNSRHSAGSYQYLNENQMVNQQPHLNYTKGANGTTNDLNPSGYQNNIKQRELQGHLKDQNLKTNSLEKSGQSRYDRTPGYGHVKGQAPKQPHQYVNDRQYTSDSVYTNDIKDRPLPKPRIKHYENNNSTGFLNHGFDLDSPTHNTQTESTYSEINPDLETRI